DNQDVEMDAKSAVKVVIIEGGLGIRRLENFNVALMSTHVWKIVTRKESLWDVTGGGFNMQVCVNDIISDEVWAWPSEWHNRHPTLNLINVPILNAQQVDKLQWKAYNGSLKDFSCREGSSILVEDGDRNAKRFLDEDEGGDSNGSEKREWG
ncbi:hypothetical protein Tco_0902456, partial [Tanacetum coccineum]